MNTQIVSSSVSNDLIPVFQTKIGGCDVQACDARTLHGFLSVQRDFSSWIKNRVEEYGFIENQDFIIFHQNGGKIGRGRPTKDYHLTLDMGKELSMVERTEKGREARRYFIECEKRLIETMTAQPQPKVKASLSDRLDAAFDQHGFIPRDRMGEIFPDLMTSDEGVLELADAIAEHPHIHVAYYDDRVMPNGSVLPLVRREIKDEIKPVVDQIVNSALRSLGTVKTAAPGLTRPHETRDEAILDAVLAAIKNEGARGVTDRDINRNPPFKSIGSIAMEKALMQLHGESKIRRKKVDQLGRPRYAWVHWQFV